MDSNSPEEFFVNVFILQCIANNQNRNLNDFSIDKTKWWFSWKRQQNKVKRLVHRVYSKAKLVHLAGSSVNSNCFWAYQWILTGFVMLVNEKIFFEVHTNYQYIWYKHNIASLYFILGRAELCWKFSSWLKDAPYIYRFPTVHMIKTQFLLTNLWTSKPSLNIFEKF